MRHRVEGRKFGREKAHRTALFRNLIKSIVVSPNGRIETTVAKAKEIRSYVERLITYAKNDTVASRRLAYSVLGNRTLVKKLFEEIAPQMKDRQGGYTRVLKTGFRKGDSAPLAIIEFVTEVKEQEDKKHADGKKTKAVKKAKTDKKPVTEDIKAADLLDKEEDTKAVKKTRKPSTKKVAAAEEPVAEPEEEAAADSVEEETKES